jgi:site-specific DNA-methyltransferase (adenine-specific)
VRQAKHRKSYKRVDLSDRVTIYEGDCLQVLPLLPDCSVDSIVTDPPYGLSKEPDIVEVLTHWLAGESYEHKTSGFMGKSWDSFVPGPEYWKACFRVLKPGGYLLVFASTRTFDLMAIALRLAGFEQHPFLAWIFGSGFPKATNLSKQIDKAAGAEREVVGVKADPRYSYTFENSTKGEEAGHKYGKFNGCDGQQVGAITAPATDAARQWDGWFYGKQSLKPAMEPILMFQKPFEKGMSGYENVLEYGTGGINVDGCRVGHLSEADRASATPQGKATAKSGALAGKVQHEGERAEFDRPDTSKGRWPANLITDGSEEVVGMFPVTKSGNGISGINLIKRHKETIGAVNINCGESDEAVHYGDSGSAARFFQVCKWSDKEDSWILEDGPLGEGTTLCGNITESQKIGSICVGAIQAVENYSVAVEQFMCGSVATENWKKDIVSTIETVTQLMTELKTLNAFPLNNTITFMQESAKTIEWLKELSNDDARSVKSISRLIAFKCAVEELIKATVRSVSENHSKNGGIKTEKSTMPITENTVSANRLFYCAKASKQDRDEGLDLLPDKLKLTQMRSANGTGDKNFEGGFTDTIRKNNHPTVKPTALMRYLCRLITPPQGTVLDMFMGSGSTGKAAVLEGFGFVGIDLSGEYTEIARARIGHAMVQANESTTQQKLDL